MSPSDPSLTKQQRIQVWREEVAASASLCTCPPTSPAASSSSTNISLAASTTSSTASTSVGDGGGFTFPRGDILPSQPTYCPTCSRLGAPSAMGLDPSSAYLDDPERGHLLPTGPFDRRGGLMKFRTKHGNHAIVRGMRNLVRRISGSSSGNGNGPLPPRGAEEATRMYRRATVAPAAAEAEAEAVEELDSEDRGHVPKLIAEKQARLKRASMLLARSQR